MDDAELLQRWRGGDRDAGNVLFERHFAVVCNFFRNKVSDGVDDLIQRTFVTCLEAEVRYRGEASFRSFLLGIARNVLLRSFREKRRDGKTFAPLEHSVCDVDPSPSVLVAGREEHAHLLQALRTLPLDLQIALELYFWESWTMREIASALDVPQGTAASRLRRAKVALKEALAKGGGTPPSDDALEQWAAQIRSTLA
ncbi:MAG: sigma-70 family RNA polymerase sigma factor [Myxococcota bacterium]